MSGVECNIDVLKDDAKNVWEHASKKTLSMKEAIPTISVQDFSIAFDASELSQLFVGWREDLGQYLSGVVKSFCASKRYFFSRQSNTENPTEHLLKR
ncbi:hypothetical protein G7066_01215 [Leucobacter coleopterorum]|uniref:Uncharacterized protein n=1 Tax=Leucobacter coleopterorum TaxID=2714933 RepID=A0ABX6JTQ2_9MICO|nr:hypothetical protein [Leucobacter coleopterorum]QIM17666.1 hypothetical protein G7066_01215 [Leucobacter coleopterorum]